MFIAGHTMGTPEMTLEEAFAFFARIGCAGSELVCQEGYRCGVTPALDAAERRRLREETRRSQVDGLIAALRLAADLGAGVVRAYGGKEVPAADHPRAVERVVRSLREAGGVAADLGLKIAVENH